MYTNNSGTRNELFQIIRNQGLYLLKFDSLVLWHCELLQSVQQKPLGYSVPLGRWPTFLFDFSGRGVEF